eukprot:COSAG01_NODE_14790_length_1409_cov_15.160305_1_plen_62_part_10
MEHMSTRISTVCTTVRTWSFPTKGGAKNAYIMGDDGVGYLDCLILVRKSDLPKFFIPKIEEI